MPDTYTPPVAVARNAQRALDVRATKPPSQQGMTAVGLARANQLANRDPVSLNTIQRMASYFARHEVDKQGSTWDEQGKGWQAWNGWGGDEGRTWVNQIMKENTMETKAGHRHNAADQELIAKGYGYAKSMMETMTQLGHAEVDPDPTKAVKVLTPEGLSPRQDAVVLALAGIVETSGKFSQGISESGAHYCIDSPYEDAGIVCAHCVFYQGGACQIVDGAIDPEGMCKYWVIPEQTLVTVALEPVAMESEMDVYENSAEDMVMDMIGMDDMAMKTEPDNIAIDSPPTIEVGDDVRNLARRLLGVL
jgi:hypothetical protein